MKNAQCKNCYKTFHISSIDEKFYANLDLPLPTHCPDCRCQRRMARRNERSLYSDKCDMCNKNIISTYSSNKPYTVYCHNCWWSDKWEATDYGINFNFSQPFFKQFKTLQIKVPRVHALKVKVENCDYGNYLGDCKNCYLTFGSIHCEDCYYGNPYYCKSCVDSLLIRNCELCYECITSENLYNCYYSQDCFDSHDLMYCYDCKGCSDCVGCAGLRNKQYYIFNQAYSKDEYKKEKKRIDLCDSKKVNRVIKHFNTIKLKVPRKFMMGIKNEKVSGNYINNAEHSYYCFDVKNCENVKYSAQVIDLKDCYDNNYTENNELCVDYLGSYMNLRNFYSFANTNCENLYYCEMCNYTKNSFGCINTKKKENCILNKIYTKHEYEVLFKKIKNHMQNTGEWGEYFPINISPFAYNETVANEYFSLKKEDVLAKKWTWQKSQKKDYQKQTYRIPPNINNVKDDICQAILTCKTCMKNYKIIPQELAFYKQLNISIPKLCPDCRHLQRVKHRTPRSLWKRECMKIGCYNTFETAYPPEGKELVYCERCYNQEIY